MSETHDELELDTLPGVGPATKQKLNDAGILTILDLATSAPMDIADAVDIDISKAVELNNKARKKLVEMGRLEPDFISAAELLKKRKAIDRISTGSKNLDDLLGGGIETWAMTEFYGEFGSGKCVSGDTKVVYVNDEHMHFETIAQMYEKYGALNGERNYEEGHIVPIPSVKVIGYDSGPVQAAYLYREQASRIFSIGTERGRRIDAAFRHKFLVITDQGLRWQNAGTLKKGDSIAVPKSILYTGGSGISEDDARFLGLFAAEGTRNPISISNSEDKIIEWTVGYLRSRFGFTPTVMRKGKTANRVVLIRKPALSLLGPLASSNSFTKRVPQEVIDGNDTVVLHFLAGYSEGDGFVEGKTRGAPSNSRELIEGISYLLCRLGISCTVSVKLTSTGPHYQLSVAGEDREKLGSLPFLSKSPVPVDTRNTKYGVPLGRYLRSVFRETVSANRWHMTREGLLSKSGTVYELLTRSAYQDTGLGEKVLNETRRLFLEKRARLAVNLKELSSVNLTTPAEFKSYARTLAFPINHLAKACGLTKSGINNYFRRGVPEGRTEVVRSAIATEASRRAALLGAAIETIGKAMKFDWDSIVKVEARPFDDYVYDLSVPEGHAFVGGNLPTLMHNSQICHTLCVMVQTPHGQGGLEGGAVYIDTEGTFRPERIAEIAEARGLDSEKILSGITVARAYNSAHQELIVKDLGRVLEEKKVKLVILDSAVAHYRAEFLGRATLAERQQRLNKFMHQLLRTAEIYNVAVVVTNQVQAAPDSFFGDPTRPTGGHVVAHTSTYRIYLRKAAKNRIARMVDSPYHPERDVVFMLDEKGVDDPAEETIRKR